MTDNPFDLSIEANYAAHGVPAVITVGTESHSVTAIDQTRGAAIQTGRFLIEAQTPSAYVRVTELAEKGLLMGGVLIGATMTLNSKTWVIADSRHEPTPMGGGEVKIIFREQ